MFTNSYLLIIYTIPMKTKKPTKKITTKKPAKKLVAKKPAKKPAKKLVAKSSVTKKLPVTKVTDSKPEEVKDAVISIRISSKTLQRVKAKAEKKGIPYQTMIGKWILKKVK